TRPCVSVWLRQVSWSRHPPPRPSGISWRGEKKGGGAGGGARGVPSGEGIEAGRAGRAPFPPLEGECAARTAPARDLASRHTGKGLPVSIVSAKDSSSTPSDSAAG